VERCYFSGALCDDFFVLCRLSIQVTPAAFLLTSPLPSPPCIPLQRSITLRLALRPWRVLYTDLAIKVANIGGLDTEQTSIDGNRARHDLTSWLIALLIALLIDCFLECGMHDVTFISPHSEDIKRKLLKLLHNYINEVQI